MPKNLEPPKNLKIPKESPKKPYFFNPQSGLSKAKFAKLHAKKQVRKLVLKAGYRRETTLPHDELPVAIGNFDTTRANIVGVVLHTTVCCWPSAANHFNTPYVQASSNYLVKLNGGITLFLEEYYTPYTNGNYASNQSTITIEHEDCGDYNGPRTPELYASSVKLVREICKFYGIPIDRTHIKKHSEVSLTGTACPDSLDVDRIVREAAGSPILTGPVKRYIKLPTPITYVVNKDTSLWNFNKTGFSFTAIKPLRKGESFGAYGYAEHTNGSSYYMTQYSFGNADVTGKPVATNGVNLKDLSVSVPPPSPVLRPIISDPFIGDYRMTQGFGENPSMYASLGMLGHNGQDFATPTGIPAIASTQGVVYKTAYDPYGYGNFIEVWDDKQLCVTLYAHLRSINVTVGQRVIKHQLLGYTNNTGYSTGSHVHFAFGRTTNTGYRINQNNGYYGWLNPNTAATWSIENPTQPAKAVLKAKTKTEYDFFFKHEKTWKK